MSELDYRSKLYNSHWKQKKRRAEIARKKIMRKKGRKNEFKCRR